MHGSVHVSSVTLGSMKQCNQSFLELDMGRMYGIDALMVDAIQSAPSYRSSNHGFYHGMHMSSKEVQDINHRNTAMEPETSWIL